MFLHGVDAALVMLVLAGCMVLMQSWSCWC